MLIPQTTKKPLFKPVLISALFLLSSTSLLAENSNDIFYDASSAEKSIRKSETTGLVSGAIIGGMVAGPPGAIVAGVIGIIAGNHHSTKKQNKQLHASLAQSQTELYVLQEEQKALQEHYQLALEETQNRSFQQQGFRNANLVTNADNIDKTCCTDIEFVLHFKSNSTDIERHYSKQLKEVARLSSIIPNPVIEITGYADRRGSNKSNLGLSRSRIKIVETRLVNMGVNSNIIQSNAFGENQPLNSQESLEGNFFDRRVNVKIRSSNNDFLTFGK